MKKKYLADDDSDSQKRTNVQSPKVCVDYLSYLFNELDLAASWRMVTKQKNDIVNGIRLENASWRTWAKQRNHLKTVSPDTLNWLKDNDVTWLYGPLHTVTNSAPSDTRHTLETTLHERGTRNSTAVTPPLKSALKKITTSDILRRSVSQVYISDLTYGQPKLRFHPRVEQYRVITEDEDGSWSNMKTTARNNLKLNDRCSFTDYDSGIRSVKRIEPTVLNSSSYPHDETTQWSWDGDKGRYIQYDRQPSSLNTTHWFWKRPTVKSPSILLCSGKSQPISESALIDAIPHHQHITKTKDRGTCHDRILDQQQKHSSPSFVEILVNGLFIFGIHR